MKILLENLDENRDKFLELRKTHIGASDVPTILGLNKFKSPLELWAEKRGTTQNEDNDRLWYGREAEALIAKLYERRNPGVFTRKCGNVYVHPEIEWLTSSPDYFVHQDHADVALLECKTTTYQGEWSEDSAPDYAHAQLITQMAVMGMQSGICGAIVAGDVSRAYFPKFDFHQELWDQIFPALKKFHDCMMDDSPPDARGGDLEIIQKLFPATFEEEIDLSADEELGKLLSRYSVQKARVKLVNADQKKEKDVLDGICAKIRLSLGEYKRARHGEIKIETKEVTRKAHAVSESRFTKLNISNGGNNGEE